MPRICPPNTFCFSTEFMMIIIGILSILLVIVYVSRGQPYYQQQSPPVIIRNESASVRVPSVIATERAQAPQPLRDWMNGPEFPPRGGIASIPINIPTQGLPEAFQSIGNLNADGKMLPLYGRRTGRGSYDRWNYYTRTDTFNPVPIPLRSKGRDCMDDIGCQEIFSGDTVTLDGTGESGQVRIFRYDGPKYFPGLV
jgi:hypothetical protein